MKRKAHAFIKLSNGGIDYEDLMEFGKDVLIKTLEDCQIKTKYIGIL